MYRHWLVSTKLRGKMTKSIKYLLASLIIAAQMAVPANAINSPTLTSKQFANVKALFAAFATSDPDKIASASVKFTKASSSARYFAEMIKNNHATIRYFKSINAFGMPSGLAVVPETKGTSKVTGTSVVLNSVNDAFDGKYSNFKFDASGKISNFNAATTSGSAGKNVSTRILPIKQSITTGSMFVTGGYIYQQPDSKTFVQLEVKNNTTSLKSWSFANGRYASAENKYYSVVISPVGCLYPGQVAFMQSTIPVVPVIAAGTGAAFEAPTFDGCGDGSTPSSSVFRFITG